MTEEKLFEEFSRMNNELIDARRELLRANALLAEKDRFLARILELSPAVVSVIGLGLGRSEYSNRDSASLLGYGPEEAAAMGGGIPRELVHPDDLAGYHSHLSALGSAKDGEILEFEYRAKGKGGEWRWLRSRDAVFERDEAGRALRSVCVAEDITARKLGEEALREASTIDPLTGIRNRRGFEELAVQQLRVAARQGSPCALVFIDIDRFKEINDGYGHAEGDEALREAAGLLRDSCREGDIPARFGGDEFVLLLANTAERSVVPPLDRLIHGARAWNARSGKPWRLEFSVGTAIFDPVAPESLDALVARADQAMYRAKKAEP